ncbi:hypothetical protein [Nocardioides sp. B-3]|uniref:hypothetical protein n=1 Tax=Nocardioides sp. B-3 TaxID=2895565 RepID=UPI002152E906|nr:hypothetical protein [Nocardioides sp. B-3]UUZ57706.1 hypothetical protein LP418_14810 [Nocardioides sp. B-3]
MSPLKRLRKRASADAPVGTPHADPAPTPPPPPARVEDVEKHPFRLGETLPVLLLKAAHPKQAVLTAAGLAIAAGIAGRPLREIGPVFVTVLAGQTMLGWDND